MNFAEFLRIPLFTEHLWWLLLKWAAQIELILNDDGTVRICADYKETINQTSLCDKGPVPNTEDLFATLNGGEKFSKLYLRHAYQQLLLSRQSLPLLTFSTH